MEMNVQYPVLCMAETVLSSWALRVQGNAVSLDNLNFSQVFGDVRRAPWFNSLQYVNAVYNESTGVRRVVSIPYGNPETTIFFLDGYSYVDTDLVLNGLPYDPSALPPLTEYVKTAIEIAEHLWPLVYKAVLAGPDVLYNDPDFDDDDPDFDDDDDPWIFDDDP